MTDKYEGLIDAEGYIDYNYFYNLLAEVKRLREEKGIIEWAKAMKAKELFFEPSTNGELDKFDAMAKRLGMNITSKTYRKSL